jgi:hypothetical protein
MLINGSENWALNRSEKRAIEINEMPFIKCICA